MRYLLVIYGLLAYASAALAAPSSIPSAEGWTDFNTFGKEASGLDSIDKSQIENHPLNQAFPASTDIQPVKLVGESSENMALDTPLTDIVPKDLNLKTKNDRVKEFKPRKVYDYREKPPAPFFQKERFDKKNVHLPGVFYQADYTRLLFSAVDQGSIGAAASLLDRGADINGRLKESGITPLMLAAKNGFGDLVQYLVIRGAKLNIHDNAGSTALHYAAAKEDYATINFLLDNGASINAVDNTGKKPLDYLPDDKRASITMSRLTTQAEFDQALLDFSASNSYVGVSLAISKGANVNTCDKNGDTPLLVAARNNNSKIVALLLSHGANPMKVDRNGMSAMDYAAKQKNGKLAQLVDTYTIKYELEHGVSRPKKHIHHPVQHSRPQHKRPHAALVAESCTEQCAEESPIFSFFEDVSNSLSSTFSEISSGLASEPIEEKPLPRLKSDTAPVHNSPKIILPDVLVD